MQRAGDHTLTIDQEQWRYIEVSPEDIDRNLFGVLRLTLYLHLGR